jgi:hypothetical protein
MARFHPMPIEKGLAAFYKRGDVPLMMFVDGGSTDPQARTFWWPPSDAYGKLTRNLYREVTLAPVPMNRRYLPLRGVYVLERTIAGDEWRWLDREAAIRLPGGKEVTLQFALSPDTPYESTEVDVDVNGGESHSVTVKKGEIARISIWIGYFSPDPVINIRSRQSFYPATVLHNQDPRRLAVQLKSVALN